MVDQCEWFRKKRERKRKKELQKGTVVVIQKVFHHHDANIAAALRSTLVEHDMLMSKAYYSDMDPGLAEDLLYTLKNVKLVRARKPTRSIKKIARAALRAAMQTKQSEAIRCLHGGYAQRQ